MSELIAAISVDLDEVRCYTEIHGLEPPGKDAATAVYDRALPRLIQLFEEEQIPATFFVIGRDLEREENSAAVAKLDKRGFEVANHSYHHYYDLTRRPFHQVRAEISQCSAAIAQVTGKAPVGFRAPGYTVTDELYDGLRAASMLYDSSVFPCPPYQLAKALAIVGIKLRGRVSHSISDDARVLTAPNAPYRVGRPYWKRGDGLLELPIGVTSRWSGRLPYIGTTLALAGKKGAAWLTRRMAGQALVNLELHGIDAADPNEDGLRFLAPHQPDLRRSAAEKLAALRTAITTLRDMGYRFTTLEQAARHFEA